MNLEQQGDNTPPEGDNKPNPPTLPGQEQHADEGFGEFSKNYSDLQSAYKAYKELESRYEGSSREGKRLSEERQHLQNQIAQLDQYKSAFSRLEDIAQKDPEIVDRIKKALNPEESDDEELGDTDTGTEARLSKEDRKLLNEVRARQESDIKNRAVAFREKHKDAVSSDEEWSRVLNIASSLDGKSDKDGRPYTVETALRDAMIIMKPDVIADRAKMEAFAEIERRDSASESADLPPGRSDTGEREELSPEYEDLAEKFGVSKERLAKRLKARKAKS
jgi:hypothetical protein